MLADFFPALTDQFLTREALFSDLRMQEERLKLRAAALVCYSVQLIHRIYRNKRPGRLIFKSNKKTFQNSSKPIGFMYSPLWKITPPKAIGFVYSPPPLKNHLSKPIGFVYSPLWKVTHQNPSVSCTPPFEKSPTKSHRFCVLPPPLWKITYQTHRFCVLPPLKSHCFW